MIRIAVIFSLVASAVLAEDSEKLPPIPDAAEVRSGAKRGSKPCALLVQVDRSAALAALSRKVPLGAVQSEVDEFRREFCIEPCRKRRKFWRSYTDFSPTGSTRWRR